MASILLIQSDAAARAAISDTIGTDTTLAVCGAVDALAAARTAIARRVPDLIIADLRLSDGPLVNLLGELRPGRSHVMVLTGSLRDPHLMHTLRHGADAYFVAGRPPHTLLNLIRRVLAGESPMAPEIARHVLAHFNALNAHPLGAGAKKGPTQLTDAEQRLLHWISEGYVRPEIARGLGATTQQIGLLTRSVYRRLHVDLQTRHGAPGAA